MTLAGTHEARLNRVASKRNAKRESLTSGGGPRGGRSGNDHPAAIKLPIPGRIVGPRRAVAFSVNEKLNRSFRASKNGPKHRAELPMSGRPTGIAGKVARGLAAIIRLCLRYLPCLAGPAWSAGPGARAEERGIAKASHSECAPYEKKAFDRFLQACILIASKNEATTKRGQTMRMSIDEQAAEYFPGRPIGYNPAEKKKEGKTMTKKHFIALADAIRVHELRGETPFTLTQLEMLAAFCQQQNSNFNRKRWLDYVAGKCGPNGGQR